MPVSISDLKKAGVSSGAYKPLFTADASKKPALIKKIESTLSSRIIDSRTLNLENYRTYWAIDLAHEVPFLQTTPTMVQNLLSRHMTAEQMLKELKAWGLSEDDLFLKVEVPNVGTKYVINPPVFYKILIPVVKAYHTIRTASLYAERDTSPLFKFVPLQQTDRNRVKCDIWSDIVETISTWYGYAAYMKQAIQQMLKYGVCLAFPLEEWHCEKQIVDGRKVVQKEGIRYAMPHPTRMAWDLSHPLPTINTDTGCEWALHWHVPRYGDILDNRNYWNRNCITHSSKNWFDPTISHNYFQEVFPCQLRFPVTDTTSLRREDKAAFYATGNRDHAVFLTTVFWKLIPKDWGLAEYSYPVWHRFDVANDDTVIWAAPCAYNPLWFMGFDFDSQAGQHSSLSLEAIPWQDHLGNLLSQMILTAKQNLVNIIYYDKNLVDKSRIDEIKNLGEGRYRGFHFIDYDSLQLARGAGLDARNAFHQVNFQPRSVAELQQMISTALTLMERVLQFTAQETGAVAPHYQSRGEIDVLSGSASLRRNYTASGVDEGIDAWRSQIVTGAKAYLNNEITGQVSSDIRDYDKHVQELGFRIVGRGDRTVLVSGKKASLPLETFTRSNIGPQAPNDPQAAQSITQALTVAFQNEAVFAAIGVPRIVKLLEQAVKLAGGPRDFDLTSAVEGSDQTNMPAMMQQLQPILQQLQQSMMETIKKELAEPLVEQVSEDKQKIQGLEMITKQLQTIWRANGMDAEKLKLQAAETEHQMKIDAAKFEAEQNRLNQRHELDLKLSAQRAGLDATRTVQTLTQNSEQAKADLELKQTAAAVDARNKIAQTETDIELQEQAAAVDAATKVTLTNAKAEAAKTAAKAAAKKPAKPKKSES
jgi:hypothetical protein